MKRDSSKSYMRNNCKRMKKKMIFMLILSKETPDESPLKRTKERKVKMRTKKKTSMIEEELDLLENH